MINSHSFRKEPPRITHLHKISAQDGFSGLELLNPVLSRLSNSIPVYQFKSGTHELVKLELIFKAGSRYQDFPLTASFTNSLLREGSQEYSSYEIADTFDLFGASLILSCERDRATVGVICMAKYLSSVLPLLESIIKFPSFPQDELNLMLARQKQEFHTNMEKVGYVASREFNETLFGKEHPYGRMAESEDFNNLRIDHIKQFHRNYYSSDNCEIFISSANPELSAELIHNSFGKEIWGINEPKQTFWPDIDLKPKELHFARENAVQSAIRIGMTTITPDHEDFTTLKVLNTLLGGFFGSRLMKNIREEKGLTYGIGANLISFEKFTYMVISSEVNADKTKQVIDEVFNEISLLHNIPVIEEELNLVKNFMIGGFLQSIDGPFSFAEKFKERHYLNLEDSHFLNTIQHIQNTTSLDIMNAAKLYYPVNQMIRLVVGKTELNN